MSLVDRVKQMLLQPNTEWETIAAEQTSSMQLYKGYIAPLAAIGPVASFIGLSIIGISVPLAGQLRVPMVSALSSSLIAFILSLIGVLVLAIVINSLAPKFDGEKNELQAFKLSCYASTPAWLAGIFHLLPLLGMLGLLASLYSVYLLYIGLPVLMKCPKDKSLAYTAVVIVCAIVLFMVIGAVSSAFTVPVMAGMPH